jgi:hypothetical protein
MYFPLMSFMKCIYNGLKEKESLQKTKSLAIPGSKLEIMAIILLFTFSPVGNFAKVHFGIEIAKHKVHGS